MVHDEFVGERVTNVSLLHLLIDHGVYDADAAVHAERQRHLLVHRVEVRVAKLVVEAAHADYTRLVADGET